MKNKIFFYIFFSLSIHVFANNSTAVVNTNKPASLTDSSVGAITGALAAGADVVAPSFWWLTWFVEPNLRSKYLSSQNSADATQIFAKIFSNIAYYFSYNLINPQQPLQPRPYFFWAVVRCLLF